MPMYYVYMLRCEDNSIYTGITTNINRRVNEHLSKSKKGAKYTRQHTVKAVESLWTTENKALASKLEYNIKKLQKNKKEELIVKNNFSELFGNKLEYEKYKKIDYSEII